MTEIKAIPSNTGVYFCRCGGNISGSIDPETIQKALPQGIAFRVVDFLCSEEGKEFLFNDLKSQNLQRVVIAACSPRDQEVSFRSLLSLSGINPYLMQMVNIREHIAWVTEDKTKATAKAVRHIKAALLRTALQEPLEAKEMDASKDVLVIGAGPAGLKAGICLAEAGRKVTVVERLPYIGGLPVLFEALFPDMQCGPCMLEPLMGEIFQGYHAHPVRILNLSEVIEASGYFGNFIIKIRQSPRYIHIHNCVGCGECVAACPITYERTFGTLSIPRKAIDFAFPGALPNVPHVDRDLCLRFKGQECNLCMSACPVGEEAFDLYEQEKIIEIRAGAIIIATGSSLYDCEVITNLGYGKIKNIYTSLEFERIASSNGPTGGIIRDSYGNQPSSVAIIHCAGSLDNRYIPYCSGICCSYAFKFNHILRESNPSLHIYHLYREISLSSKDTYRLFAAARDNPYTSLIRYEDLQDLKITQKGESILINHGDKDIDVSIVILCPPIVPSEGAAVISDIFDLSLDSLGFYESINKCTDPMQSTVKGIYLAGACNSPMNIQGSINQAMAAVGCVLSALPMDKKLQIDPVVALVDEQRCSGCKVCLSLCPFKAITFDSKKEISLINSLLCKGCGLCASTCPSGAIKVWHFTSEQIFAEIEGLLA